MELAERAARTGADVLLSRYGRPAEGLERKSSVTDPVSDADRASEEAIRELLAAERPGDGLLAEEGSRAEPSSDRRWIVDPLDGTVNYLYGFPAWCVSVALHDDEGGAVGVVYDALRDEAFTASRGSGARLNGERISVRRRDHLSRALVATGFGYERERRIMQAEVVRRILPEVRDIRRAGAAALDLSWLAAGRIDAYWERGLSPWDWAAGRLLVQEAGGQVAELGGEPYGLAAANPALLPALVRLVAG